MTGQIVKIVSSKYFVDTPFGVKECVVRKRIKNDIKLVVGDFVVLIDDNGSFVIDDLIDRKNSLIRPYVANIDIAVIVISSSPKPDFLLVDKVIINCIEEKIEPIIVVNKCDLKHLDMLEYSNFKVFETSATMGTGINELKKYLSKKTVCLLGQSAVGKSSLINAMLKTNILQTGELAKKTERGKHTTRQTELLKCDDFFIIDTCGFSLLYTIDIEKEDLRLYYEEFVPYQDACRYHACTHTTEPDCEIIKRVGKEIPKGRYERYKQIYNELEEKRRKKYD